MLASGLVWLPEVGSVDAAPKEVPWVFLVVLGILSGLDHPTRRRIYEHLLILPGDHFRSIVRTLRLGLGTGRHHVDVLVRLGLLKAERINGRCRYYPTGQGSEPQVNNLYTCHWNYRDLRARVLFAVRRSKDPRPSVIARTLRISRQLVAYHLSRLQEMGYVTREGLVFHAIERDVMISSTRTPAARR